MSNLASGGAVAATGARILRKQYRNDDLLRYVREVLDAPAQLQPRASLRTVVEALRLPSPA
jgi:hypothetical protein